MDLLISIRLRSSSQHLLPQRLLLLLASVPFLLNIMFIDTALVISFLDDCIAV